jgi:transposase
VERIGVEGTGTYGAGLTRFARADGLQVVEVNRPDRSTRRRHGKSDPIDAQAAARATLAGVAATTPKTREGQVEMIRVLRVARRGTLKARVAAAEQLHGVLSSAPEELRQPLLGLKTKALVGICAAMRPGPLTSPTAATKTTLRTLARRWQQLQAELDQLDCQLQALVAAAAPPWSLCPGSGSTPPASCSSPPATTPNGSAPRPPSRICAAPRRSPASSGRTDRHRLNRGGDRHANHALWRIALVRMHCHHPPGPTSSAAPNKACPSSTSCAVSSLHRPRGLFPPHQPTTHPSRLPKIGGINEPHQHGRGPVDARTSRLGRVCKGLRRSVRG